MDNQEVSKFTVDKRLMKLGGSLVVAVPNEVVEQWNLGKGDEVRISVEEGVLRIEPKQSTKIETISEEMVEAYSKAMKGIQAKVEVRGLALKKLITANYTEFRSDSNRLHSATPVLASVTQ